MKEGRLGNKVERDRREKKIYEQENEGKWL